MERDIADVDRTSGEYVQKQVLDNSFPRRVVLGPSSFAVSEIVPKDKKAV